ncbi:MAG: PAS domain-containing sensor histidine kinase, partial [Candidatus Thorarchaeota archaeon]
RMLGYSRDEIVSMNWADLTGDMSSRDVKRKIIERKKGISERYELNWRTKGGEIVPTIISATPYFNSAGDFVGTFAVVTEISRQKELEQTQQFYLDLITHDIANQLQVIITSSGLIDSELPSTYIEDAKVDILDAVDRCNRLITKVKRAAELRFIPLQKTDLRTVLRAKVKALEKIYGVRVEFENIKKKINVQADTLLGELIWNLLENAVKHNPKEEKQIWVSGHSDNGMYHLSIADDGPGISNARKTILFERRKGSGGVGLTLVSQMARKYGGIVSVHDRIEGKPSLGAKFVLSLQITK